MKNKSVKGRAYQYEMMRVVAMFMIVLHHVGVHGVFLPEVSVNEYSKMSFYAQSLSIYGKVGVALFMMITGFFMIKSKPRWGKMKPLMFQIFFYLSIGFAISLRDLYTAGNLNKITFSEAIWGAYYPFPGYWFITAYIILYYLLPFINPWLNSMGKRKYIRLLFICTVILSLSGYVTGNYRPLGDVGILFLPYLMGAYFRKYPLVIKNIYLFLGIVVSIFVTLSFILVFDFFPPVSIFRYIFPTPLIVARDNGLMMLLMAGSIFLLMQKIRISTIWIQKWMSQLGKYMLGVYLLHDNRIVRGKLALYLAPFLQDQSAFILIKMLICALVVFIGCIMVEWMRQKTTFYLGKLFFK